MEVENSIYMLLGKNLLSIRRFLDIWRRILWTKNKKWHISKNEVNVATIKFANRLCDQKMHHLESAKINFYFYRVMWFFCHIVYLEKALPNRNLHVLCACRKYLWLIKLLRQINHHSRKNIITKINQEESGFEFKKTIKNIWKRSQYQDKFQKEPVIYLLQIITLSKKWKSASLR